jgi:transcriptional regulator GlxA family with amidase domain
VGARQPQEGVLVAGSRRCAGDERTHIATPLRSGLGKSPLSYFQDLRVARAQSLLHGSDLDLDAIAAEVGYVDGATLRTLLRERLGRVRANLR